MRIALLAVRLLIPLPAAAAPVPLDLSGVRPGPISVTRAEDSATITWPDETGRTHRDVIELADTREFGSKRFEWRAKASGWTCARVAVWDVAGNGAFVNPFWRP